LSFSKAFSARFTPLRALAAKGAGEVAQNIQGVAQAAQSTSHGATDSQKAAKSQAQMPTHLRELVGRFKLDTNKRATNGHATKPNKSSHYTETSEQNEAEFAMK
jgi:hypothetical protein